VNKRIEESMADEQAAWCSRLKWTLTKTGNLRRIVKTPNHIFVTHTADSSFRALYKGGDGDWIVVNESPTVEGAKIALMAFAKEAGVDWQ
jgi:hypothetical protein